MRRELSEVLSDPGIGDFERRCVRKVYDSIRNFGKSVSSVEITEALPRKLGSGFTHGPALETALYILENEEIIGRNPKTGKYFLR